MWLEILACAPVALPSLFIAQEAFYIRKEKNKSKVDLEGQTVKFEGLTISKSQFDVLKKDDLDFLRKQTKLIQTETMEEHLLNLEASVDPSKTVPKKPVVKTPVIPYDPPKKKPIDPIIQSRDDFNEALRMVKGDLLSVIEVMRKILEISEEIYIVEFKLINDYWYKVKLTEIEIFKPQPNGNLAQAIREFEQDNKIFKSRLFVEALNNNFKRQERVKEIKNRFSYNDKIRSIAYPKNSYDWSGYSECDWPDWRPPKSLDH